MCPGVRRQFGSHIAALILVLLMTGGSAAWPTPRIPSQASPRDVPGDRVRPKYARFDERRTLLAADVRPSEIEVAPHRSPFSLAAPAVYARNADDSQTVDIAASVRADRFHTAGYTGTNARVANIEGGTPWREHESLNWVLEGNIFRSGDALAEPASTQPHATSVSHVLVGKAPAEAVDATLQRGIAFGVPAEQFFAGNIANNIGASNFAITNADLRNVYHTALVTGVGGNAANRVDVVNSSWSGLTSDFNLNIGSKILDAVVFEANETRGSTVVFSAGNSGPSPNGIGRPVSGFNVIAVAALGEFATDTAGTVTYNAATAFSDRGPITFELPASADATSGASQGAVRPRIDIAAPGLNFRLARYDSASPNSTAYANLSGTSFAAPTVSGGIALLADYAHTQLAPASANAAVDGRVMRAVLINSADKTGGWSNGQSWNGSAWATTQGLDFTTGGGRMNLDQAYRQYVDGMQLINPSVASPSIVASTGWARATLDRPNAEIAANADFVTDASLAKYTEFNTTLNWFVKGSSTDMGEAAAVAFHNLDLEVWCADADGTPTTLVARSEAAFNNVEHLSFLLPESGRYLVRVTRPGGDAGTYYSFDGDTTSDVFGLAWMARPSLVADSGTTTISASTTETNILVAPDSGQIADLHISGIGTKVVVHNRVLVGGSDYAAGGTGTLTIEAAAALDVSNRLRLFPGSALNVANATLSGGVLTIDAGANFQLAGDASVQMSRVEASAPIRVASGTTVVRSFIDTRGDNSGRLHITNTAATFELDGDLVVQSVITGANGLTKNGGGGLVLAPAADASNEYSGTTLVNSGTLRLGAGGGIPTNGHITVAAGAIFDISNVSNTRATTIGTLALAGGTFRVPTGSGDYHLRTLEFTGGSADFTGTTDFKLRFVAAGTAIRTNPASTSATWTNAGTSRVLNDFTAGLAIDVAAGSTASGIDLDAGVIFSGAGVSGNFNKTGSGTLRLTNPANTAHFDVQAGTLRVDDLAALGSGNISLNGGTLAYGGATTGTTKPFAINAGGGSIEVTNASTTLTLNGTDQLAFGSNTFTKAGPGTLTLAGSNTGTTDALTNVNAGRLRIASGAGIPSGSSIHINSGGLLELAAAPSANVTVHAGGTLFGTAGLASTLTIAGAISPGSNTGERESLAVTGSVNLDAGGIFAWDVDALPFAGSAGTNWDFLSATGSLGGTANAANRFTIHVAAAGPIAGFNPGATYTWTIAHFDGAMNLNASDFAVTSEGWTGANDPGSGAFSVLIAGSDVQVQFAPVPEPAALGLVVGMLAILRRRRRLKTSAPRP